MEPAEDYYEILQVHYLAEPEVIEAAYKKLAQKYHPDLNKSVGAVAAMKKINVAHDVLSDPIKRRDYDTRRQQYTKSSQNAPAGQPKPTIDPYHIEFKNVRPGEVKRASFTVFNTGGQYSKINISNPDTWLKVVAWHSLASTDELPLKVDIEAQGKDSNQRYSDVICISLDNVQARVNVILTTRMRLEFRDNRWHEMSYDNLRDWVKTPENKAKLDAGEELPGKYFRYRFNLRTRKYQVRLRYKYKSKLYETP